MKAYQQQWIDNSFLQNKAQDWFEKGLLSEKQNIEIKNQFPLDFYQPNPFIRIALFLFTCLACIFSVSLLYLIFESTFRESPKASLTILALAFGVFSVFLLEFLIKTKKIYQSGIDNALLYSTLTAFVTAIYTQLEPLHLPAWLVFTLIMPLFIRAYIRYADVFVACVIYFLTIMILVDFSLTFSIGKTLLPFIMLLFSIVSYWFVRKLKQRADYLYYETCLDIFKTLTLASVYLSVNYFIVREGNAMINKVITPFSPQIALAPLYYFFTILIPIAYIVFGLKKRDRTFLVLGLLTAGFSFFTYRYYFGIIPTEIALLICGTLLIGLASFFIHHLKQAKYGFTYIPDNNYEGLNIDTLLLSELVNHKLGQHHDELKFGGGNSGGGGAGGKY
ncbi:hypothetical protein [Arcicella rosea]|uniref:Uncharacterized protein n=1 Tax=Arcicella rosea TaxID=502909 RepID=A0A841F0P0_9BACT|nr:hypothetical protein [Arcicella rosea]MBB6005341.1 hypothetical protein [Arcicella rosea]